jgi:hypothetical protein
MTPTFNTIDDMAQTFRRRRKMQYFRMNESSPGAQGLDCSACGTAVTEFGDTPRGYRAITGHYFPGSKRFRVMHYTCSWGALLGAIGTSYSLAEAGGKVERLSGRTTPVPTS